MEERQGRTAFGNGIVGNQFIGLGNELGCERVRLARQGFGHGAHLSAVGRVASMKKHILDARAF
jgi:hypothetical protein